MRISSRCEYGLRAMIYLARAAGDDPVPLTEIAHREDMPTAFLERILARLRDGGLVASTRGASGGYRAVARPPRAISVGRHRHRASRGPLSLVGCLPDEGGCARAGSCASQRVWRRLDDAISGALGDISLDELSVEAITNMKTVYFDHAATTAVDPRVFAEMEPYFVERYGNPSEIHRLGRAGARGRRQRRAPRSPRRWARPTRRSSSRAAAPRPTTWRSSATCSASSPGT